MSSRGAVVRLFAALASASSQRMRSRNFALRHWLRPARLAWPPLKNICARIRSPTACQKLIRGSLKIAGIRAFHSHIVTAENNASNPVTATMNATTTKTLAPIDLSDQRPYHLLRLSECVIELPPSIVMGPNLQRGRKLLDRIALPRHQRVDRRPCPFREFAEGQPLKRLRFKHLALFRGECFDGDLERLQDLVPDKLVVRIKARGHCDLFDCFVAQLSGSRTTARGGAPPQVEKTVPHS